jgi:hypothetical protein
MIRLAENNLNHTYEQIKSIKNLIDNSIQFLLLENKNSIYEKYKIDQKCEQVIYLLYFSYNDNDYLKVGYTKKNIYNRLTKINNDLQKLDKNITLYVTYCSKLTGIIHHENKIHDILGNDYQTLKQYLMFLSEEENLSLNQYMNKYTNKKIKSNTITGWTEMYNITSDYENNENAMNDIIKLYFDHVNQIHYNDSFEGKIGNCVKK